MDRMPPQRGPGKSPARRGWQFSLAALFLATTAVCVVLGLLNQRVDRQRRAIAAIHALGGQAAYNGSFAADILGSNPSWLASRIPRDFLASLATDEVFVDLFGSSADDEDMRLLANMRHVVWLRLDGTAIGDAGLARLQGLTDLKTLRLYGTRVTDDGLVHLESLSGLEYLDVGGTAVSERGVASLQIALPGCAIVR